MTESQAGDTPVSPAREAELALADPAYREAVVDLLGVLAYGEISAFERLAEDAKLAPTLEDKLAIAQMAASEVARVDRLHRRIRELDGDPFVAMRRLLTENHEPRARQLRHIREAIGIARALLQAGVIERLDEPDADGRRYRLTVDLPPDFALNQPLSTFALAAIDLLDPASDTYALDVVSVIEATLDDPRQILAAQLNKAKGEAVAQMKAEGIEYDERMELLEEISYPKPLEELLGHAFGIYVRSNPWAADAHLSPKSVVRDMWENAFTFRELVNTYGLTRAEGAVLRYLSDAFKALRSGVPSAARTTTFALSRRKTAAPITSTAWSGVSSPPGTGIRQTGPISPGSLRGAIHATLAVARPKTATAGQTPARAGAPTGISHTHPVVTASAIAAAGTASTTTPRASTTIRMAASAIHRWR